MKKIFLAIFFLFFLTACTQEAIEKVEMPCFQSNINASILWEDTTKPTLNITEGETYCFKEVKK